MKEKYVAYLDILGFKDLVYNNHHERIYELYNKVYTEVFTHALVGGQLEVVSKEGKNSFTYDAKSIDVNSLIVSDSLILWSNDASVDSFVRMIVTVKFVLNYFFKTGVPLRGAIVKGYLDKITKTIESRKDNSVTTLIGSGLVDAYTLEGTQDWSGCLIDKHCVDYYQQIVSLGMDPTEAPDIDYLVENTLIRKYPVPKRDGKVEDEYVIDWVSFPRESVSVSTVRDMFSMYNKNSSDEKVERKIKNTIAFIEAVSKNK